MQPYFTNMLLHRVKSKLATNIVVVGQAGIGKSYIATQIARHLDRTFTIDQVVFTYKEFLDLVLQLKMGKPIVFDEPSYAMGKRDWYKDLNKVLVQTIESFRFKVHPLIIPIINKSLLDKTIRNHLIQYQVLVYDRGKARVYKISPSQFTEKVYAQHVCSLRYGMMDYNLCNKNSCLGCKDIDSCNVFRAQYERKKASIQEQRYELARDRQEISDSKELTFSMIEVEALQLRTLYTDESKCIDLNKLMIALMDKGIKVGRNKAYRLKTSLEMHYPELFA